MHELWKEGGLGTSILVVLTMPTSYYCSNVCQREHWEKYKKLCQAISEVELRETHPKAGGETLKTLKMLFPSHPRQRSTLTKLVGRKLPACSKGKNWMPCGISGLKFVLRQSIGRKSTYQMSQ